MRICILFTAVGFLLVAGCASVPMASQSSDTEAKAFAPDPDKAKIYVNFDQAKGSVIIQLTLDGRIVTSLTSRTYAMLTVTPGEHILSEAGQLERVEQARLNAEAGKTYFYKLYIKAGWMNPRAHLTLLDEAEGKERLMKSKRAEGLD